MLRHATLIASWSFPLAAVFDVSEANLLPRRKRPEQNALIEEAIACVAVRCRHWNPAHPRRIYYRKCVIF